MNSAAWTPRRLALFVWVVTFVLFSSVLSLGFVAFDDQIYVTQNPLIEHGLTRDSLIYAWTGFGASNYHPITWMSHLMDISIYGQTAWGHHLTSLLFHATNAALLLLVVHQLLGRRDLAVVVALAFALHPQRVESVAWVSERKDVISGFFFLLMLWSYTIGHQQNRPKQRLLAVLWLTLGLLAKPMLVTAPAVLILVDVGFLGRFDGTLRRAVVLVAEKLPLFALSALESWATVIAQQYVIDNAAVVTSDMRWRNVLLSLDRYVESLVAPRDLLPFYAMHAEEWTAARLSLSAALLVSLTVVALACARRAPPVLVGWLWFLGTLVPVIGVIRVGGQAMADRYTYLPHIGLWIALVVAVDRFVLPRLRHRIVVGIVVAFVVWLSICAALTRDQIRVWSSSEALWRRCLEVDPLNAGAHGMLARLCLDRGDLACALEHSSQAVGLGATEPTFHHTFALALLHTNRLELAEETAHNILANGPSPLAWRVLGDVARARHDCKSALANYRLAASLGENVDYEAARCHFELGDHERAYEMLKQLVDALGPRAAGPHYWLGRVQQVRGQPDDARRLFGIARASALEHADPELVGKIDAALATSPP